MNRISSEYAEAHPLAMTAAMKLNMFKSLCGKPEFPPDTACMSAWGAMAHHQLHIAI
jgi:hypothetical protein